MNFDKLKLYHKTLISSNICLQNYLKCLILYVTTLYGTPLTCIKFGSIMVLANI